MINNIVIGAGFTAAITKILIGKNSKIIGTLNHSNLEKGIFIRRKSLECNKLLSSRAFSYGTLNFNLKNGLMHDRLTLGGNSNIWGGNINLKNIPKSLIKFFKKNNISFKKLSLKNTGTISNDIHISQLQNSAGHILKTKDIPISVQNGHIINFSINKNKIFINVKKSKNNKYEKIQVKNLFLCIGSIQVLDLLYRSKYLKNNDTIEFSEFRHEFKWNLLNSKFKRNVITVRYHFCRALGHYFGIQHFSKYLKFLKFIPLCIDQNFYPQKMNYKLQIKDGTIIEKNKRTSSIKFGESIHYCNLRINNVNINKFLSKINKNIFGLGMSCINQNKPGPISNEIIMDALKKIRKTK